MNNPRPNIQNDLNRFTNEELQELKEIHPLAKRIVDFKFPKRFIRSGKFSPEEMMESGISLFRQQLKGKKCNNVTATSLSEVNWWDLTNKTTIWSKAKTLLDIHRLKRTWADQRFPQGLAPLAHMLFLGAKFCTKYSETNEYEVELLSEISNPFNTYTDIEAKLYLFYKLGIMKPSSVRVFTNDIGAGLHSAKVSFLLSDECAQAIGDAVIKAFWETNPWTSGYGNFSPKV